VENPARLPPHGGRERQAGRILGVDLGTRRVGLALTDSLQVISSPYATLPMSSEGALVERLQQICREQDVRTVVIGLPTSADGTEGPGCARSRRLAGLLESSGIRAELQDESWSSRDAEKILREVGKTRRAAKEKIDAVAASLILRDYLEESSPR
jgi:putative holliday junction resolvase